MKLDSTPVLRLGDIDCSEIIDLLGRFGLQLSICQKNQPIAGSFWGDDEAGLIGDRLFARPDTPIHSILHETSHYICMDPPRRDKLNTHAHSNNEEENAVCYLQILLADQLKSVSRGRIIADMDNWGYSFRLGSTQAWFDAEGEGAGIWLIAHQIIENALSPHFKLRQ
ncbi:MAG: hypothetical protein ACI9LO_000273 [Planctomycetota bacterium]|jgi:hypothetical protein